MLKHLDSLFIVKSELEGDASPDISGLIGQYAHGNEPSHHILYFYTMAGQPWKTADRVREVLAKLYTYHSRRAFGQRRRRANVSMVHSFFARLLSG